MIIICLLTFHLIAHFLENSRKTIFSSGCFFLCSWRHVCTKNAYAVIRPLGFESFPLGILSRCCKLWALFCWRLFCCCVNCCNWCCNWRNKTNCYWHDYNCQISLNICIVYFPRNYRFSFIFIKLLITASNATKLKMVTDSKLLNFSDSLLVSMHLIPFSFKSSNFDWKLKLPEYSITILNSSNKFDLFQ